MFLYHINIGSNLGDSRPAIERAVAGIFSLSEGPRRRSEFVESEPWGYASPNRYLNLGVEITSSLPPLVMLKELKKIEKTISPESHRNPDGSYRDRLLDIDMIFALADGDPVTLSHPDLTLPHPRALKRPFVITPVTTLHPATPLPALFGT